MSARPSLRRRAARQPLRRRLLPLLFLAGAACEDSAPPPPPAPAAPAPLVAAPSKTPAPATPAGPPLDAAQQAAADQAKAAGMAFAAALKTTLVSALQAGGPPEGLKVCNEAAPRLLAEQSAASGLQMGRSSLRLRSPANAGPDWVRAGLQVWGEGPAAAAAPQVAVVGAGPDEQVHLLLPIAVEAPCLACHGAKEALSGPLSAELARLYPADQATGYALGDLRGALWISAPVKR